MEWFLHKLISVIRYFKDTRNYRFLWQKLTRGFSDRDTWNLEYTIAKFVLPRLIRFKELSICHPGNLTAEEWNAKLDDMIFFITYVAEGSWNYPDFTNYDEEEKARKEYEERLERGSKAFGEYFFDLWW